MERLLERVRANDPKLTSVEVSDIDTLKDFENNTCVHLLYVHSSPRLLSLEPLRKNTTIVTLFVESCPNISDLSIFETNTTIAQVIIRHCGVKDISPLKHNQTVGYLDLSNNPIGDISPLWGNPNLIFFEFGPRTTVDIRQQKWIYGSVATNRLNYASRKTSLRSLSYSLINS